MNDKKTEAFVALCLALVAQARGQTETAWRAMRNAQQRAENEFSHGDGNPWYAAMGLCAEEGVYAKFGRTVPMGAHAAALRTIAATFPGTVTAAREAMRKAMEAKR